MSGNDGFGIPNPADTLASVFTGKKVSTKTPAKNPWWGPGKGKTPLAPSIVDESKYGGDKYGAPGPPKIPGGIVNETYDKYQTPISGQPTKKGQWWMPSYTPPTDYQVQNPDGSIRSVVGGALGLPTSTTPTTLNPSGTNPVGKSGSSATGVNTVAPVDPNQPQPVDLDKLYADLEARLTQLNAGQQASYRDAAARVAKNWQDTQAKTERAYETTLNPLQAAAKSLGVGNADAFFTPNRTALNNLIEGNRSNASGDAAFFEKMIADRQGGLQDLLAQANMQKLNAKNAQEKALIDYATAKAAAAAKAASGSGRRKSGGSGSSSGGTVGASETSSVVDPQALAYINEVAKTNPAMASMLAAEWNRTNGSPIAKGLQGAADETSANLDAAGYKPSTVKNYLPTQLSRSGGMKAETDGQAYGGGATASNMKVVRGNLVNLDQIRRALGVFGLQPTVKQTVTTKGKTQKIP